MSVETLQTIALLFFIASGIFFAVSVFLFFAFNIPGIIGDLSGVTARRAIEDIKEKSKTENKSHVSYSRLMRGRLTEKITGSTNLSRLTGSFRQGKGTRKLPRVWEKTAPLPTTRSNETVQLAPSVSKETTILAQNVGQETTVLASNEQPAFSVDIDLSLFDSTEIIE